MYLEITCRNSWEHVFVYSFIATFKTSVLSTFHAQSLRTGDTEGNKMTRSLLSETDVKHETLIKCETLSSAIVYKHMA